MGFVGAPPGPGSVYGSPYQQDPYNYNLNQGGQQFQAYRAPPYQQQYHPPGYQPPQQQNYQPQPTYPQASYSTSAPK